MGRLNVIDSFHKNRGKIISIPVDIMKEIAEN